MIDRNHPIIDPSKHSQVILYSRLINMHYQGLILFVLLVICSTCIAIRVEYDDEYNDLAYLSRTLTSRIGSKKQQEFCESEASQLTRVNISSVLVHTFAPKLYLFNDSNHNLNWSLTLTPLTRRVDNASPVEIMTYALNASCTTLLPSSTPFVCSLQNAKLVKTSVRPKQLRQMAQLRREPIHLKNTLPLVVYQPSSGPYAPLNEFDVYSCPNECYFVVELSFQLKSHITLEKPEDTVIHL